MPPRGKKGICRYCHRSFALTSKGLLWVHWEVGNQKCEGSGEPPVDEPESA